MSSPDFLLDSISSSVGTDSFDIDRLDIGGAEISSGTPWQEPGYEGSVDYRIRQLSYSSLLTLHSCPRKFQLYKLRASERLEEPLRSSITFAFGHIVGEGIQLALQDVPESQIIWRMFLSWSVDLFAADEKAKKSFWFAVIAVKRFILIRKSGVLNDYRLVHYRGKPATELSFAISFPDGFRYRGHVDAVLEHKVTGEVLVLECKTTKAKALNPNLYKNSAQGIGYSIILDAIYPELSSYKVLYLVYTTSDGEYTPIPFTKSYLQRALWIRELLLDIETIKMYEQAEVYPMHGESCVTYSKETEKESRVWEGDCEYINTCTLSTGHMTKPCVEADEDKTDYQVTLSLADLLDSQMNKVVT